MPTRKQRRRQQKGRRHEYEFVYVDEEGQEVAVDEPEPSTRRRDASKNGKAKSTAARGGTKPIRKIDPPSWNRVIKRSLIFAPLIFLAFGLLNQTYSLAGRVALTLVYTGFFIPFMYLMDRAMYRMYLRRSGNPPPARTGRRR